MLFLLGYNILTQHNATFSPADDVIHMVWHSCPETVVPWVARLRLHVRLFPLTAFVKPPKLPTAEQVGLAVVGPDEGCLHPVHHHPAPSAHVPFRDGPRIASHGHCVLEDPVLRSWKDGGKFVNFKMCSRRKTEGGVGVMLQEATFFAHRDLIQSCEGMGGNRSWLKP